jgi:hypothetical protein
MSFSNAVIGGVVPTDYNPSKGIFGLLSVRGLGLLSLLQKQ